MHLTRMRFGGVPPFTDPVELQFDSRVNLFVGPNASGKSRLLSEIDQRLNKNQNESPWPRPPEMDALRLMLCDERGYSREQHSARNMLSMDRDFAYAFFRFPLLPTQSLQ